VVNGNDFDQLAVLMIISAMLGYGTSEEIAARETWTDLNSDIHPDIDSPAVDVARTPLVLHLPRAFVSPSSCRCKSQGIAGCEA
jgi:hypothetical protein